MAIEQGGYTSNLDEIMDALGPQSGGGEFVQNYMRTPSTWDAEKATEQWDVIKQSAKDAGMSVMDWLDETAFQGSQNPQGLGQQILAGASYPFRLANELTMESGVQGGIPFVNYDPIGGFLGLMSGAYGIPANKWAKGEDVSNIEATAGALAVLGPLTGGAIRGTANVARRAVPESVIEGVDQARRRFLKGAGVVTGGLLAPVVATKTLLGSTATKVAVTGAKILSATAVVRAMANDNLAAIFSLFKKADESLSGGVKVKTKFHGTYATVDTVGENARPMIDAIGDIRATRSALVNSRSLGTTDRAYLEFFGKFNQSVRQADEGVLGSSYSRTDLRSTIDPATGLPVRPDPLPPSLTISPKGEVTLDMDAFRAISKENSELAKIRTAFEEKWDLPTKGQKGYLWDQLPGPKFADDVTAVREFRDELSLLNHNREAAQRMTLNLDNIELAVRNITHLEKTNPDKLRAILNKMVDDITNSGAYKQAKIAGTSGERSEIDRAILEILEDMLEALK